MFQAQNRETKLVLEKLLCPPRWLWRRAWQDCISQQTQNLQDQDQDRFLVSDRSCPKTDGLRPHHWSGERCELPSGVRDGLRSPDHPKIFHYFQHSGWPLLTV